MASAVALGLCFAAGIALRLSLFRTDVSKWLSMRTEISNPLTSWERALEGVALADNDISPYQGDLFHETPVMLWVVSFITKVFPTRVGYFFVLIDILSGLTLVSIGKHFSRYLLKKQVQEVKHYAVGVEKMILKIEEVDFIQISIVAMSFMDTAPDIHGGYVNLDIFLVPRRHFLNPYSVAVCLGKSTGVVNNLFIFLTFMFMLQGREILCIFTIALATYQSLYPIMLLVPAAVLFHNQRQLSCNKAAQTTSVFAYSRTFVLGIIMVFSLILFSYFMEGSNKFLYATTGFILGVPDLSPNLGVFWYFFTEMFEHFRPFFICVFQINAFLYTVPLAIKLRDHPVFMAHVLVTLMSIFKSYPSYADVAIYITLLPMWKHVFLYMRNMFLVTNMFLCCTVLSPILWHLWIYAGSANANFYFAIALTFSTAQIFLITDLMFGYLRREFALRNGLKQKLPNGKEAQVILD